MPEQKFPERSSRLSNFPDAENGVEAKDPRDTAEFPLIPDSDKSKSTDYNTVFRTVHACICSLAALVILLALIIQSWGLTLLAMIFAPAALVSAFCRLATVDSDDAGAMAGVLLCLAGGLAGIFYISALVLDISKAICVLPTLLGVFLFSKFNSAQSRNSICALLCFAATVAAIWGANNIWDSMQGILVILSIIYGASGFYLLSRN